MARRKSEEMSRQSLRAEFVDFDSDRDRRLDSDQVRSSGESVPWVWFVLGVITASMFFTLFVR